MKREYRLESLFKHVSKLKLADQRNTGLGRTPGHLYSLLDEVFMAVTDSQDDIQKEAERMFRVFDAPRPHPYKFRLRVFEGDTGDEVEAIIEEEFPSGMGTYAQQISDASLNLFAIGITRVSVTTEVLYMTRSGLPGKDRDP